MVSCRNTSNTVARVRGLFDGRHVRSPIRLCGCGSVLRQSGMVAVDDAVRQCPDTVYFDVDLIAVMEWFGAAGRSCEDQIAWT